MSLPQGLLAVVAQLLQLRLLQLQPPLRWKAELQRYQVAKLPGCQIAKLPSCRAAKLPSRRVAKLPCCQVAELPSCRVVKLSICEFTVLSSCQFAALPTCQVANLPCCQVAGFHLFFYGDQGLGSSNGDPDYPFSPSPLSTPDHTTPHYTQDP